MPLIKDQAIVPNAWTRWSGDGEVPSAEALLIPVTVWNSRRHELRGQGRRVGLCLAPADAVEDVEGLSEAEVIAIEFPKFTDGRGYSHARRLRERLAYRGELRAVGDVLADQLFFMMRCGFDAFELREGKSVEAALAAFRSFSVTYQGATDEPRPLFARGVRERGGYN